MVEWAQIAMLTDHTSISRVNDTCKMGDWDNTRTEIKKEKFSFAQEQKNLQYTGSSYNMFWYWNNLNWLKEN